jgi:glycerol-3-phosphate dehydrogenase
MLGGSLATPARAGALDALEREPFDCVVIGGGIAGAGVACEAARRGLRTALLEAEDFASGTSGKSSKLIHGGLRYLAQGEVGLVRETALERKAIFRQAPHLAERRWMCVPARSRAGLMKFRVGIGAYEKLGAVEGDDLHRNWGADEIAAEEPLLDRATYPFACAYREYLTDDARLVLANLRAAVAAGAVALNHAPVDAIALESGRARGVEATCRLSGRRVRVRARAVVNAAGPWVDAVRRLEDPQASPLLLLSKGVHVVMRLERLPVNHLWVIGTPDGRSIFTIPRGNAVYVGTTDTHFPRGGDLWPEVTSEDVEYLLAPLPRYFAIEPVKPEECFSAWAGLRPLIAEPGKKPSEISRRDEVLVGPAGVVSIAGGKLTGYRPMTRRCVEQVAREIGAELAPPPADDLPLPGGDFDGDLARLAASLAARHALPPDTALRLARLYGAEAPAVLERGAERLAPGVAACTGEVDWAVREEGAATVEDVLFRRTRIALYDPAAHAAIAPIATLLASRLGWSEARRAEEVARAEARLAAETAFARPFP